MSDGLRRYMVELASNVSELVEFMTDAKAEMSAAGLREDEQDLLLSGDQGRILCVPQGHPRSAGGARTGPAAIADRCRDHPAARAGSGAELAAAKPESSCRASGVRLRRASAGLWSDPCLLPHPVADLAAGVRPVRRKHRSGRCSTSSWS